ncbi:unnamed protein product [Chondrus crispus]|uniref:Uncharacterized protein n=1 Tax=Chondrus crispus TaxID=2769 RepID=R7QRQ5_CHOCR|nr:unnamed protein product [Chondrus crispus]CDF41177.1 unnamed protein product [Chondrus crispus]|eukprot:XP_005711471.1 unnamed protein product [Chondrus crispus]
MLYLRAKRQSVASTHRLSTPRVANSPNPLARLHFGNVIFQHIRRINIPEPSPTIPNPALQNPSSLPLMLFVKFLR